MNLINPAALAFALLAIPIVLLYLLRLQRREQTVSSTLLWRQITLDREANTLWQRLRKHILLFLQLLTLAFFVFALIRPYISVPATLTGRVIVMLDASASMRATDVAPSRFAMAQARASALIEALGANDQMLLIAVDDAPRALSALTSDHSQLRVALDAAQPALGAANWSAAIALAGAVNAGSSANDSTTIVISDGAGAGLDDLKLLQGRTRLVSVGGTSANIALTALTLRRTVRGLAAFARVSNLGAEADKVLVSLKTDGALADARELEVPAGGAVEYTVNGLSPGTLAVEAHIGQAAHNALAFDDDAYAVNSGGGRRNTLLLTPGNRFLEQALAALPELRVTRAVSAPLDAKPYDLYVLDRVSTTLPARANVLLIGAGNLFSVTGAISATNFVRAEAHPVTQQVDWRAVNVLSAQTILAPDWLRPLIIGQGGPLLYAGENPLSGNASSDMIGGAATLQRVVLLPFELRRSDLPLQIAFPILIANSVDWLAPPSGINVPLAVRPGEVVALPVGSRVAQPDGVEVTVDKTGFAATRAAGVYHFKTGEIESAFAVNFRNAAESDITPGAPALGSGAAASAPITGLSQRELWHWLAALALLVLLAEWWVYQRGVPLLHGR